MSISLQAETAPVKILVLGASGMLGHVMFRILSDQTSAQVYGTLRSDDARRYFEPSFAAQMVQVDDLENRVNLVRLFESLKPHVVVNCTSLGKSMMTDPMRTISMFSLLPHRLSHLCRLIGARLVQIGSDGVFSGAKGRYREDDLPDATDTYGIAKYLGEVNQPHAITLRTSIIGPELSGRSALLEWFLSQEDECCCYTRSIFSGLPTVELARIIRDVVIPRADLHGVYHLATKSISKFDLLTLIARRYGKRITLIPDDSVVIDRSLLADKFTCATGYVSPEWPELVDSMYFYQSSLPSS